ncbi:hypothetical protein BU24DRAFT_226873 [Aaosphaeria arxii CBS 175.79]|uniref:DUF4604 domain-containing protein n=1 Tax=Aaosphaeria arxii CBS 175.79 TaxID=1450172 RepID=A0A6A5XQ06_9PLEO|nr:uncharacterized protein BU24DRAFT_226873 [Aaosphaeria arxii CBS 175.79]KAF2015023.1 hypothetical protein BU24DRAFT_226873 [Aaosphaeria arxii CBS 175.79]
MSNKAKGLTYQAAEPAFLQRLRGGLAGEDSARHERPIPRNKRLQKDDDEDDAPTYVLEDTNQSLSKAEYDALVAGEDQPKDAPADEDQAAAGGEKKDASSQQSKDKIAEVGKMTKKRKAIKVIGADAEDEEDSKPNAKPDGKAVKKPKKKAKVVKLSFGDDE